MFGYFQGMVVEAPFAPFFLNHVLGRQHSGLYSSIDELPSLDQSLYKSLCFIKVGHFWTLHYVFELESNYRLSDDIPMNGIQTINLPSQTF